MDISMLEAIPILACLVGRLERGPSSEQLS